jgi:uncharacterized membrane protein
VTEAIGTAIRAAEDRHGAEIRFVVEAALEPRDILQGVTPRERALVVFSQLRVWDTEHNDGVLLYVLLADHAVEIVVDRGLHATAPASTWSGICRQIEEAFKAGRYGVGSLAAIEAVAQTLQRHAPASVAHRNELPDSPVLL